MPRSGWEKITLTWLSAPQSSAPGRGTELVAEATKEGVYNLARLSPWRAPILHSSCSSSLLPRTLHFIIT